MSKINNLSDLDHEITEIRLTAYGRAIAEANEALKERTMPKSHTASTPPAPNPDPLAPSPESVHSPKHYTSHPMECIDEMVLAFGPRAAADFCRCNAWKYRYRAGEKTEDRSEDLAKSDEYMRMLDWLENHYPLFRTYKEYLSFKGRKK